MASCISSKISKESAMKLLNNCKNDKSSVNSRQCRESLDVLFGPGFDIFFDNCDHRLMFFCYVCRKVMNNILPLYQHASSGQHLRKKDVARQSLDDMIAGNFVYCDSLHDKIRNIQASVVGLQYIEIYEGARGNSYCKCNLCGSHGDENYIYNHIVGKEHIDKYINMKVKLEDPFLNDFKRFYIMKEINRMENFSIKDMVLYSNASLYPYVWEKKFSEEPYLSRNTSEGNELKKYTSYADYRDLSEKSEERKKNKFFSYSYFLNVLAFMSRAVFVEMQPRSMTSYKLRKMALTMQLYIQNLLFLSTNGLISKKRKSSPDTEKLQRQRKKIKRSLDILNNHLIPNFGRKHTP